MTRLIAVVLMAGLAGVGAGCRGEAGNAETGPNGEAARPAVLGPNDVAKAAPADLIAGVPVSGSLAPTVDVRITSPQPEVLEQVLVREGEAVHRDQVLARLSAAALEPQAASAEAQRRVAKANYQRMQSLFKEGAISQQDLENAEVQFKAAEASAAAATKRLREATIRSPITGVVAERLHDSGDRVKDGDLLFRVVNTTELEFEASVPAEYVGRIRPGSPVLLTVTGLSGAGVAARVARVNAQADAATRQVKLYVQVPNRDRRIVAGLFASGRIVTREAKGALAIPQPGLRTDDKGTFVLVVTPEGRIARRDVMAGVEDEVQGLVQISSGLAEGEIAIIGPIQGLRVGDPVEIVNREG